MGTLVQIYQIRERMTQLLDNPKVIIIMVKVPKHLIQNLTLKMPVGSQKPLCYKSHSQLCKLCKL